MIPGGSDPAAPTVELEARIAIVSAFVAGQLHEDGYAPPPGDTQGLTEREAHEAIWRIGGTGGALFAPMRRGLTDAAPTWFTSQAFPTHPTDFEVEVAQEAFLANPIHFETVAVDVRLGARRIDGESASEERLALTLSCVTRSPEAAAAASLDELEYEFVDSVDGLEWRGSDWLLWNAYRADDASDEAVRPAFLVFVRRWVAPTPSSRRAVRVRIATVPARVAEEIVGAEAVTAIDPPARPLASSRMAVVERLVEESGRWLSQDAETMRLDDGRETTARIRVPDFDDARSSAEYVLSFQPTSDGTNRRDLLWASMTDAFSSPRTGAKKLRQSGTIGLVGSLTLVWPVALTARLADWSSLEPSVRDECYVGDSSATRAPRSRPSRPVLLVFVSRAES